MDCETARRRVSEAQDLKVRELPADVVSHVSFCGGCRRWVTTTDELAAYLSGLSYGSAPEVARFPGRMEKPAAARRRWVAAAAVAAAVSVSVLTISGVLLTRQARRPPVVYASELAAKVGEATDDITTYEIEGVSHAPTSERFRTITWREWFKAPNRLRIETHGEAGPDPDSGPGGAGPGDNVMIVEGSHVWLLSTRSAVYPKWREASFAGTESINGPESLAGRQELIRSMLESAGNRLLANTVVNGRIAHVIDSEVGSMRAKAWIDAQTYMLVKYEQYAWGELQGRWEVKSLEVNGLVDNALFAEPRPDQRVSSPGPNDGILLNRRLGGLDLNTELGSTSRRQARSIEEARALGLVAPIPKIVPPEGFELRFYAVESTQNVSIYYAYERGGFVEKPWIRVSVLEPSRLQPGPGMYGRSNWDAPVGSVMLANGTRADLISKGFGAKGSEEIEMTVLRTKVGQYDVIASSNAFDGRELTGIFK